MVCEIDGRIRRLMQYSLMPIFVFLLPMFFTSAFANTEQLVSPKGLNYKIAADSPPEKILQAFIGIPYRVNGAINENGSYTLFTQPELNFKTAGLNCSGFLLAASRFLLNKNISLSQAMTDRLQDSGDNSPYGLDWDFGWDLIMNISEGLPAKFILPNDQTLDRAEIGVSGFAPRGYDLHAAETWPELARRLEEGHLYLMSFNRDTAKKGYRMQHYHVALMYVNDGNIWFYNTTGRAKKVYRRNLSDEKQRAQFLKSFANSGSVKKYVLILALPLH
jgi:hypothetical protein